jgi:hypothetical protein
LKPGEQHTNKMKKIALMLLAGSLLMLNSCYQTGPVGPMGPPGPQGNANVKGADPFTVSSWALTSTGDAYVASFTDPDVTQAVSDHGVVDIFLYYPTDGTWRSLPDIISGTQFFSRFSTGGFDIYYGNIDGSTPTFPGTWTFRSVVIAPSLKQAHPNTNWKDYNEVMKVLNENNVSAGGNTAVSN